MKNRPYVFGFLVVLAMTAPAWGHGTEGFTETAQGILVTAGYDDGEAMSYAAVEITGPDNGPVFQKGRTDRNGQFMFRPDQKGKWQIVVQDGMGHRLALEQEIADDQGNLTTAPSSPSAPPKASRPRGVITGISVIFGLSGLAYGWKARPRG